MVSMTVEGSSSERGQKRLKAHTSSSVLVVVQSGLVGLATAGVALAQSLPIQTPHAPAFPASATTAPKVPTREDANRIAELENAIAELRKKGHFAEAITPAQEVLAIWNRIAPAGHWETSDARRQLDTLTQAAAMPPQKQATLASAERIAADGDELFERGEFSKSRPLRQDASALFRGLFGENDEKTALRDEKLGYNLYRLGFAAEAEPLLRTARTTLIQVLGDDHPAVAQVSHELGYCLDWLKKHTEAGPLFDKACQIWIRTRGEAHRDTASGYDGIANHLKELGKHAEAEQPFRKALEIDQRALGEDNAQTACAYFNLAYNHFVRRKLAEAERLHRLALAIRLKARGENHPETALSFTGLAGTLAALGRPSEVEELHRKALAIRIKTLGENNQETMNSYSDLVSALDQLGRVAESEPLRRKLLAIQLKMLNDHDPQIAASYQRLGNELYLQGKYAEAELDYHKALEIRLATLGEGHRLTAEIYNDLAGNLWSQGKIAEAQPLFQKALDIRRRTYGEHHPGTASSYQNLGCNLSAQGKFTEAGACYLKALSIRLEPGETRAETATTYDNMAHDLFTQGKYAEATSLYQKALEIWRRTSGERHPDMAAGYSNLAVNLDAQGIYPEAERLYQKTLAIYRFTLGEDHPDTAFTYNNLAANLHARGMSAAAEAMAMAAAKSYEVARSRVSFTGLDRAEFASKRSPSPLVASLLAARGCDQDAWQYWESGLARGLFDDLAGRRGRPLTNDERRDQEDLCGKLNRLDNQISALSEVKALADDRGRLLDKLKIERLELQGQLARFESEMVRKYLVASGAVYALDQIQARLATDAALVGWLDLRTMPGAADPSGDHWACVIRQSGGPRWIRIRGTGPGGAWTETDDQRPGLVRQLLGTQTERAWQKPLAELAEQRLAPLEPALGAHEDSPAVRHLIVLPSPALAGIPVETLVASRPLGARDRLVSYVPSGTLFAWLQERRPQDQRDPAAPRRLLAVGDPVPRPADEPSAPTPTPPDHGLLVQRVEPGSNAKLAGIRAGDVLLRYAGVKLATRDDLQKLHASDPKAPGVAVSFWREGATLDRILGPGPLGVELNSQPAAGAILAQREMTAVLRRTRGAAFARLPGSRREVQEVAGLFDQTAVLLGSEASEHSLGALRDRGELATFAVIHLATHGEMDDLCPMNSRLLLSQDCTRSLMAAPPSDRPAFDGILSASEVMSTWKLNAELVTLSACRSGLGRQSGGEGYLGFSQALFLSGARSVVVSLWNVDDVATALLMKRFYQNLLGRRPGLDRPWPKAEALAEAKKWLRTLSLAEADRLCADLAAVERIGKVSGPPSSATRTARPYEHPYYWAAFILIGDPN
jgi:tetratricopeptide (TPR) repeat protein